MTGFPNDSEVCRRILQTHRGLAPMTPTTVARIFSVCSTHTRALRASLCIFRQGGRDWLARALWAQSLALRAVGYPGVRRMYVAQRDQALAEADRAPRPVAATGPAQTELSFLTSEDPSRSLFCPTTNPQETCSIVGGAEDAPPVASP